MTESATFSRHYEVSGLIVAPAERIFDFLDDPARLNSHMSKSSWSMGGGKMNLELDGGHGQRVGSKMKLAGRAFGIPLSLVEIVTERRRPYDKVWQTTGEPRIWVIAHYRLGFEVGARPFGSLVRVFIDYELPARGIAHWLGWLFGSSYAKWCTRRMFGDARAHFVRGAPGSYTPP